MESDRLHKEAALLSNTLADFAPEDDAGRLAVVEQILGIRDAWKDTRHELQTGEKRKAEPNREPKPTEVRLGMSEEQIKAELQRLRVNISKYKRKIQDQPDHKKVTEWGGELDRLTVLESEYERELIRLKYE